MTYEVVLFILETPKLPIKSIPSPDRKERELKFDDILHYQKIIVALTETDRIMKEIDKIDIS